MFQPTIATVLFSVCELVVISLHLCTPRKLTPLKHPSCCGGLSTDICPHKRCKSQSSDLVLHQSPAVRKLPMLRKTGASFHNRGWRSSQIGLRQPPRPCKAQHHTHCRTQCMHLVLASPASCYSGHMPQRFEAATCQLPAWCLPVHAITLQMHSQGSAVANESKPWPWFS